MQQGSPNTLEIQVATQPDGPWAADPGASLSGPAEGGKYTASVMVTGSGKPNGRFYRVSAK